VYNKTTIKSDTGHVTGAYVDVVPTLLAEAELSPVGCGNVGVEPPSLSATETVSLIFRIDVQNVPELQFMARMGRASGSEVLREPTPTPMIQGQATQLQSRVKVVAISQFCFHTLRESFWGGS